MTRLSKKQILTATFLISLAIQTPVWAEVTGQLQYGYDTNPYRLADNLDQREEGFLDANLEVGHRFESGFGFALEADIWDYQGDADDADRLVLSGMLDYKLKSKIGDRKAVYEARVKFTDLDRTYVSRTTGEIGESLATPTPDRYDTQSIDARARATFEVADDVDLRLMFDWRDRGYEDYTALDLSDLDYSHWSTGAELKFSPTKEHEISGGIMYRVRDYDSREGRDLAGDAVLDSELEYTFLRFDTEWKYRIDGQQVLSASYRHEQREDATSGYYDTTKREAAIRYLYKSINSHRLTLQAKYLDYSYDNNVLDAALENEESIGSRDGFKLTADYDHFLFSGGAANYWLSTSLTFEDYDSIEDNYVYDRAIAQLGFKVEF